MAVTFYFNESKIQIFKIYSDTIKETIPMHSHPKNGYELHLIVGGRGILDTGKNKYTITSDTLYVTGPNAFHKQIPEKNAPMQELSVFFKISTPRNSENAVSAFAAKDFWIGKYSPQIKDITQQMITESEKDSLWKDDILSSLAIRLISEMARLYYPDDKKTLQSASITDSYDNRLWILDQLMLDDCSNLTLSDFAKNMGVSPRQAERIIKDYYGESFKKLRYEAKMAMAAKLLEQKNISIEECSAKCGYNSASAFITAFKKKFTITPKAYMEQVGNE